MDDLTNLQLQYTINNYKIQTIFLLILPLNKLIFVSSFLFPLFWINKKKIRSYKTEIAEMETVL